MLCAQGFGHVGGGEAELVDGGVEEVEGAKRDAATWGEGLASGES